MFCWRCSSAVYSGISLMCKFERYSSFIGLVTFGPSDKFIDVAYEGIGSIRSELIRDLFCLKEVLI
jgi:hypothetical protein